MMNSRTKAKLLKALITLPAYMTAVLLIGIIAYILITGIPSLKPGMFAWKYTSENVSMMPAIINTVSITLIAMLISIPVSIGSAVFLTEYSRHGSGVVKLIRLASDTLSGIPSIVYGLFGYLFFDVFLKWGYSILSGSFTLAIMILPLIQRTAEEAILAVPDSYREGSYGLGAGKTRTIFRIVLPTAMPGILSGVILGVGRIVGETAALIYTAGTVAGLASSLMSSGRTLSVHMYALMSEGLHMEEAKGVAVVLLAVSLLLNMLSSFIASRIGDNING